MDANRPEAIQALLQQLRQEFLADLPNRIDQIEQQILDDHADQQELCRQIHSLKGLGGTHGIDILSFACHQFEEALATTASMPDEPRRAVLLDHVDVLRQIQALGAKADEQADLLRQPLQRVRERLQGRHTDVLLVEPSAALAAMLKEQLAELPVRMDATDDGLAALELYLHRRHAIVVTAGAPRRLSGPALIAAIRQEREPALCLLVTADAPVSRTASGGADRVLRRDRELPYRLARLISRHVNGET